MELFDEENKIERLEYATSTSPMGPFKPAGVILDESESGCWTVHHSILDPQLAGGIGHKFDQLLDIRILQIDRKILRLQRDATKQQRE